MPEIKAIPSYTVVAALAPDIDITTYFQDDSVGDVKLVFITEQAGTVNGNPIKEGYAIAVGNDDFMSLTYLEIDIDGNLLVVGDDANNYEININGELTYTT